MTQHAPGAPPAGSTPRSGDPGAARPPDASRPPDVRDGWRWTGWIGWLCLAAELAYVVALHQGVAPAPGGFPTEWWHPTRSWLDVLWISELEGRPALASLVAALPAAVLAAAVVVASGSAIARWLALSGVATALLFGFYGFGPVRVWEFFHWRGSLVMVTIGAATGGALASPWLARSWLALRPVWRVLLYLPVLMIGMVLLRHTTGTDEHLRFNFSPWPAVTIFGLEIGVYAIVGLLFGAAIGLVALAGWRRRPLLAAAGVVLGVAWPVLWMLARFGSLPDGASPALAVASGASIALGCITRQAPRATALRRRAGFVALGAVLAFAPVFAGRALSTGDYTVTRFVRAQRIIDALATYYDRRGAYPDELGELVELGYLERIPKPRVGFDVVYAATGAEPIEFSYQSLGSSYVLEFEFTEWVQCAYNPPWEDEFEDEDAGNGDGEDREDDALDEAWSCPESRPELW